MTTPTPDPRLDLLVTEVGAIRRQLDALAAALAVTTPLTAHPVPGASSPTTPPTAPPDGATPAAATAEQHPVTMDATAMGDLTPTPRPDSGASPATAPTPLDDEAADPTTPEQDPARATSGAPALTPARLLAAGGALVTILGVGFLLAVAIAAGLFGPVARVTSLLVLAVVLAVVARRVHDRSPEAGVALAATSTAASYGVVVAATTLYGWVPPLAGVVLALGITAAGAAVAHRWRDEILAILLHVQIVVVLPLVLAPLDPAARVQFTVFTALAFLPVTWLVARHRWVRLFRLASALTLFVATVGLAALPGAGLVDWVGLVASWVVALVVLGHAWAFDDAYAAAGSVVVSAGSAIVLHDRIASGGLVAVDVTITLVLAALFAVAALTRPGRPCPVLGLAAGVHLVLATGFLPVGPQTMVLLLGLESLLVLVAATRTRGMPLLGFTSLGLTGLTLLGSVTMPASYATVSAGLARGQGTWQAVALGVVFAALGVLHLRWVRAVPLPGVSTATRIVGAAVLALHGVSLTIVAAATLPGTPDLVVMVGNVLTTIVWVAAAIAMILRPRAGLVRVGYGVLAAAVAKLFLADLQAVDGILRAVLFVLTGLALIGASSGMRRVTAAAEPQTPQEAGARPEETSPAETSPLTPGEPKAPTAPRP